MGEAANSDGDSNTKMKKKKKKKEDFATMSPFSTATATSDTVSPIKLYSYSCFMANLPQKLCVKVLQPVYL